MGSIGALGRSASSQAVTIPQGLAGAGIPAGMGGVGVTASGSLNVGGSSDGTGPLVILSGGVILLILFYIWTQSIQGGP
jgi:hypothetical protein